MLRTRTARVLAAVAIVATVQAVPVSGGLAQDHPPDDRQPETRAAIAAFEAETDGEARSAVRAGTGHLTYVGSTSAAPLQPGRSDAPVVAARRFLDRWAPAFGGSASPRDLDVRRVVGGQGTDAVRFQQMHHGVPVLAGHLAVQLDDTRSVVSAAGELSTTLPTDVTPSIDAATAQRAAALVASRSHDVDPGALDPSPGELWVYDPSLLGLDDPAGTRLVWRFEVTDHAHTIRQVVLVDATDGTIALSFDEIAEALDRHVCNNDNTSPGPTSCTTPARSEGSGPTGTVPVDTAFDVLGDVYNYLDTNFGRDSIDDAGHELRATVRHCEAGSPCPFNNAFWNGAEIFLGAGYEQADDVVAHEVVHGLTQYTADLIYFSEAGAINESMSDVFGELVDLDSTTSGPDAPADRWLIGEQLNGGEFRDMENPPTFNDPDRMTSVLFFGGLGDNRGVHTNSGVGNKAAFLITDGGTFNGHTVTGLGTTRAGLIFYTALNTILGPGSDYQDLGLALTQACTNLIGTAGIAADDCTEVADAVAATEMHLRPTASGAHLTAATCPSGVVTSTLFSDDMETTNGNWTFTQTPGGVPWGYTVGSSQSGNRSLHVADAAAPAAVSTATGTFSIAVPAGASFLTFDHAFATDWFSPDLYDGGVVEYSTNNGASWLDLGSLPGTVNGYNDTIQSDSFGGVVNELAGRAAFGSISPSYQRTRIPLSTLAGSTVRIRFRFGTDNFPNLAFPGWFIDDLSIYTCGTSPAPTTTTTTTTAPPGGGGGSSFVSVPPARLLDTRTGQATIDGLFNGIGLLDRGSITPVTVIGRGGVSPDASAVALNVTVTEAQAPGFLTVYPCGGDPPTASNLNYVAGSTVPNLVITQVGDGGQVCLFTQAPIHAIVDVAGYFPAGSALTPRSAARLYDSRPASPTIDGTHSGTGVRPGGSATEIQVTGRAGIPAGAGAAVLNVTVTEAQAPGFLTVHPCDIAPPTASTLNYVAGSTVPNATIARLDGNGRVCVFTQAAVHLVVDVAGHMTTGPTYLPLVPARLLDTRPSEPTVDGLFAGAGSRAAAATTVVAVRGRGGVPAGATAVALNVTVTDPTTAGFVTVYPCDQPRPNASNLNVVAGQTVANGVISGLAGDGTVCIYNQPPADLVVDVTGYVS